MICERPFVIGREARFEGPGRPLKPGNHQVLLYTGWPVTPIEALVDVSAGGKNATVTIYGRKVQIGNGDEDTVMVMPAGGLTYRHWGQTGKAVVFCPNNCQLCQKEESGYV